MAEYIPPEIALEQRKLDRRRKMAELLAQQDPMQGQMVSGIYVAPSPIQGVANLGKAYLGAKANRKLDTEETDLAARNQQIMANEVTNYQKARQGVVPGENANLMMKPVSQRDSISKYLAAQNPAIRAMAEYDIGRLDTASDTAASNKFQLDLQGRKDAADLTEKEMLAQQRSDDLEANRQNQFAIAELTAANRPQPTKNIQEIVDPLNPEQMIRVEYGVFNEDAYRNGDKTGVVGISGKEPVAAKREEKEGMGRELLQSSLDDLRDLYKQLNDAEAIPSTTRSGPSNLGSSIQSSSLGQFAGRTFGTNPQTVRDRIKSSRLQLLNAIKSATGMSSQQLNSNMELQTWLQAVTDPSLAYESNIGIIDSLENAYLKKPEENKQPSLDDMLKQLGVLPQ